MTSPVHVVVVIYRQCGAVKIYVPNDRALTDEFTATMPDVVPENPDQLMAGIGLAVSRQLRDWRPDLDDVDVAIEPFIADDCDDVPENAYRGMPQA